MSSCDSEHAPKAVYPRSARPRPACCACRCLRGHSILPRARPPAFFRSQRRCAALFTAALCLLRRRCHRNAGKPRPRADELVLLQLADLLSSFLAVLALVQGTVILTGGLDLSAPWDHRIVRDSACRHGQRIRRGACSAPRFWCRRCRHCLLAPHCGTQRERSSSGSLFSSPSKRHGKSARDYWSGP